LADSYGVYKHLLQEWDDFYSAKYDLFMKTSVKMTQNVFIQMLLSLRIIVCFSL